MRLRLISVIMAVLFVLAGCTKSGNGTADDANGGEASETLWDKKVKVETCSLPQDAFSKGGKRCHGMAPDGVTFLMVGCANPYLYNIETKKSTYLLPADSETEEAIRMSCAMQLERGGVILAEGKLISSLEELEKSKGRTLVEAYLSTQDMGTFMSLQSTNVPQFVTDANYMVLRDKNGLFWLVNCDDGTFQVLGNTIAGSGTYAALIGDLLYIYQNWLGELRMINQKTGKEKTVDFSKAGKFQNSAGVVTGATCLSDGSICVILRSSEMDMENGTECAVVVRNPSGADSVYPLGKVAFNCTPDTILDSDGCLVIRAASNPAAQVYKIERISGTVSLLFASEKERVAEISLEECSFTGGKVNQPEGYETLFFLETLSDRETILCQNMAGQLILYRPSQSVSQYLLSKNSVSPLLTVPFYCSNCYDVFFAPGVTDFESYLRLKVTN